MDLKVERSSFKPGETVEGTASWSFDAAPEWIEVRLFWYTEGKGTQDLSVQRTERWERPPARDERPFRFELPAEPYSFSGKLISLVWALELVAGSEAVRAEILVSPSGAEILL